MDYVLVEVESRERMAPVSARQQPSSREVSGQSKGHLPTAAVLPKMKSEQKEFCYFCESLKYSMESCSASMELEQKKRKLAEDRHCFLCMMKGHLAKYCCSRISCSTCHGKHMTSMCDPNWKPTNTEVKEVLTMSVHAASDITLANPQTGRFSKPS